MTSSLNTFEKLIESFNKISSHLESSTEIRLKQISEDRLKELNLCAETFNRFDNLVSDLSETCSEIIASNDILHSSNTSSGENFLPMSYEIQSDTVKCINELFNMPPLTGVSKTEKTDVEQKKKLLTELHALAEKSISDVKDGENIISEVKSLM